MRVNENEMSMRWNNNAWSVLESGLQRYQSWDSSWCLYVKPDLKLRGISAASTIRPTCALRTIVIIFSQKKWQGPARPRPFTFSVFQARPMQNSITGMLTRPRPSRPTPWLPLGDRRRQGLLKVLKNGQVHFLFLPHTDSSVKTTFTGLWIWP